jgi:transcription termination/antitermination protein NusG
MIGSSVERAIPDARWYAVMARSRGEKVVAAMLGALGITHFLPIASELRQWSDRKQVVNFPLFPGYLFVRINPSKQSTLPVLKIPGVVGIVGNHAGPSPIPVDEIESVRRVVEQGAQCVPHPFLKEGDRVRIVRGALAGVEGILIRSNSETRLAISIEMIQRSISVSVSRHDVEPVSAHIARSVTFPEPAFAVVEGS